MSEIQITNRNEETGEVTFAKTEPDETTTLEDLQDRLARKIEQKQNYNNVIDAEIAEIQTKIDLFEQE